MRSSAPSPHRARSILLVGEHGVGKSALLREVLRRLGDGGFVFQAGAGEVNAGQSYIGQLEGRVARSRSRRRGSASCGSCRVRGDAVGGTARAQPARPARRAAPVRGGAAGRGRRRDRAEGVRAPRPAAAARDLRVRDAAARAARPRGGDRGRDTLARRPRGGRRRRDDRRLLRPRAALHRRCRRPGPAAAAAEGGARPGDGRGPQRHPQPGRPRDALRGDRAPAARRRPARPARPRRGARGSSRSACWARRRRSSASSTGSR